MLKVRGLLKLVRRFEGHDYTVKIIANPQKFQTKDMLPTGSRKAAIAKVIAENFIWLSPGCIWLIEKPKIEI